MMFTQCTKCGKTWIPELVPGNHGPGSVWERKVCRGGSMVPVSRAPKREDVEKTS